MGAVVILALLSWGGFATTLLGVWLVARHRIEGWLWAAFSEVLWMSWAAIVGGWALFALSASLTVLNLHGFAHWMKLRSAEVSPESAEVSEGKS